MSLYGLRPGGLATLYNTVKVDFKVELKFVFTQIFMSISNKIALYLISKYTNAT